MCENMTFDRFDRADSDLTADTFGLSPGVAGVQIEHKADVFCPTCGRDIIGDELADKLRSENPGHNHDRDDLGNITAVLASTEWDCPGANCGHCGIPLDVRTIHYEGVCQPDTCPEIDA